MSNIAVFAKLDANLWHNEKAQRLGIENPRAFVLWINAITYCVDQLTDGDVSAFALQRYLGASTDDIAACVYAGLFEEIDDGIHVHDYEHSQTTSDEIEDRRKHLAKCGKRGAAKRWGKANKKPTDSQPYSQGDSQPYSQGDSQPYSQGYSQPYSQGYSQGYSQPIAEYRIQNTEEDSNSFVVVSSESNAREKIEQQQQQQNLIPNDWQPSQAAVEECTSKLNLDLDSTLSAFINYHRQHATKATDWDALFIGWCRKNPRARKSSTPAVKAKPSRKHEHSMTCQHVVSALDGLDLNRERNSFEPSEYMLAADICAGYLNEGQAETDAVRHTLAKIALTSTNKRKPKKVPEQRE